MAFTVLQIIPALGTGGAEQACVDIAAALVARGNSSLVVSSGGRRVDEIEKSGAKHILCEAATKNPALIIRNAFWLADLIKTHKVDIVHARSRAPAWSAYIACKLTGCRYVTTFHAAYKFKNPIKKAYNSVMARADRCIAISDFVSSYMKDSYKIPEAKIRLINRGIDISNFDPSKITIERCELLMKTWGIKPTDEVVMFPARLSPIKNHQLLIEAFAHLKREGKKVPILCFVGDDQGRIGYTDSLESFIRKEGLEKKIKLVGACSDMPAALALASVVVMPSKVPEGFGRVPVEAMAMGVPVIASDLGATQATVIDGKTGWLLPPQDPKRWAACIEDALNLSQEVRDEMALAAREHVETNFTTAAMVEKTLAVYDELMNEMRAV